MLIVTVNSCLEVLFTPDTLAHSTRQTRLPNIDALLGGQFECVMLYLHPISLLHTNCAVHHICIIASVTHATLQLSAAAHSVTEFGSVNTCMTTALWCKPVLVLVQDKGRNTLLHGAIADSRTILEYNLWRIYCHWHYSAIYSFSIVHILQSATYFCVPVLYLFSLNWIELNTNVCVCVLDLVSDLTVMSCLSVHHLSLPLRSLWHTQKLTLHSFVHASVAHLYFPLSAPQFWQFWLVCLVLHHRHRTLPSAACLGLCVHFVHSVPCQWQVSGKCTSRFGSSHHGTAFNALCSAYYSACMSKHTGTACTHSLTHIAYVCLRHFYCSFLFNLSRLLLRAPNIYICFKASFLCLVMHWESRLMTQRHNHIEPSAYNVMGNVHS